MCMKEFATGKNFDKNFNLAIYVHPYVCLSVLVSPITCNLKQIYILVHCFSVPRRQSLPLRGEWGGVTGGLISIAY